MGREASINPAPAAASLLRLGVKAPALWSQGYAARRFVRRRTHNPVPAVLGIAGSLVGGLGKRFQSRDARDKARFANADALAARAAVGDDAAFKELERLSRQFATQVAKNYAATKLAEVIAARRSGTPVALTPSQQLAQLAGSPLAGQIVTAVARTARRPRAPRRTLAGYDAYGQPVYRQSTPRAPRAPRARRFPTGAALAGAPAVGAAGTVAGAGAAAVAGVVIGGLAVGLLIGTGLRKLFGTAKAVRAEEAAVQGALVLRQTRAQLEAQLGRPLRAPETRALFAEYAGQLQRLGFQQDANGMWFRPRGAVERFLG